MPSPLRLQEDEGGLDGDESWSRVVRFSIWARSLYSSSTRRRGLTRIIQGRLVLQKLGIFIIEVCMYVILVVANPVSLMNVGCCWVQAMAQVGGLVMLQPEVGGSRDSFFFVGMDKVRFRKPVIAGDTLVMRMTITKLQKRFGIAKMEGKAYVGGEVVCEGEFIMAMGSSIE
ncbi:hypothetical protein RJ639_033293 [Escallonia herrerae]|uniref:Beta-hydroxyacyl-ACP dehydratase n=1 Tax=Escallonia herrerae TaxID=1293975 RepID=A0AA88WTV7_9ASTE|nr:hypothetical protein RJ639_033293 [Escallonia herrerae]